MLKAECRDKTQHAPLTLRASSLPNNKYCELNVTDLIREYVASTQIPAS